MNISLPSWLIKTKVIHSGNCKTIYKEKLDKKLGLEKLSFEDCKQEVANLGIKSEKEYRKAKAELVKNNWPGAPYAYYKDQWVDWADFCGFKKIEFLKWDDFVSDFKNQKVKITSGNYKELRKENWPRCPSSYYSEFWKGWHYLASGIVKKPYFCREMSFAELCKEVKQKQVSSFKQYRKFHKKYKWPTSPHVMFKEEWVSFNHFFGKKEKKFLNYKDLVKEVRKAGITSMLQYHQYRKKHNKKMWSSNPNKFPEFTSNFAFFGKKQDYWSKKGISSYKESKTLTQLAKEMKDNGIKTRKEYRSNCKKFGWPANPDDAYRDCWKGWDHLFSREKKIELSWVEFARQVKEAKIKGFWDYRNRYKNYKGWPSQPMKKYSENWVSWMDLLGKGFAKKNYDQQHKNKISWQDLKDQVKKANIQHSQDYRKKYKKYGWTSSPEKSYPECWTNWGDFLGIRQITFSQLKKEVKSNNIKGQVEYRKRYKEFDGWPAAPESIFKKEWKDWFDFLSKPRDKYHPQH